VNVLGDVAGVHDSASPALLAFLPIIFLLSRIRALRYTPRRLNLSNVCEYTVSKQSVRYRRKRTKGKINREELRRWYMVQTVRLR